MRQGLNQGVVAQGLPGHQGQVAPDRLLARHRLGHGHGAAQHSLQVQLDGQTIGHVGELHPQWRQGYELPSAPVVFE
ncbi:MAG: hypothetical protein ACKOE3_04110, partial [Betaproteobacteria bacterium]